MTTAEVVYHILADSPAAFTRGQVWSRRRDGRVFQVVGVHLDDRQIEMAEFPALDHRDYVAFAEIRDHFVFVGQVQR